MSMNKAFEIAGTALVVFALAIAFHHFALSFRTAEVRLREPPAR